MLSLENLLTPFGFNPNEPTKLVRHQDARIDLNDIYKAQQFETYQAIQSRPVFSGCTWLISFLGSTGTHAIFVGLYRVSGVQGPKDILLPPDFLQHDWDTSNHYEYQLTRDARFDELRDRLVIEWGKGTRSWVQNFKLGSKTVVEILPQGYVSEFPGYLDFCLRFDDLQRIVSHPIANREWHRMLGALAGVYLILDMATGMQYVGSAYGEQGILGRWAEYARNGHGGNKQLSALLRVRPQAAKDFQFCVLQTLPTTLTAREVIAHEVMHKQKLGSRAHGLNSN